MQKMRTVAVQQISRRNMSFQNAEFDRKQLIVM